MADFFSAPELAPLLRVLGLGLLLKGLAVTPRAMLQRELAFRPIGVADIGGGVLGAAAGITAAVLGAGTWSMAVQVLLTDLVIAVVLLVAGPGHRAEPPAAPAAQHPSRSACASSPATVWPTCPATPTTS